MQNKISMEHTKKKIWIHKEMKSKQNSKITGTSKGILML